MRPPVECSGIWSDDCHGIIEPPKTGRVPDYCPPCRAVFADVRRILMSTNRRGAVPWLTGPWTEGLRELKIARIERRLAHNVQAVNELANIMVCDADGLPHAARGPRKREQEPVFSKPMEEYIGNYGGDWHRPVGDAGKARTPSYNFPTDCDRADRAWQEERDACFSDLEEADVIDFPEPASTEERWAA